MKWHLCFVAALGICLFVTTIVANAQVRADTGSIAIGGSVTNSPVITGIPQEKVDELVRDAKRPLEELTAQQRDNIILLKENWTSMNARCVPRWAFWARMTLLRSGSLPSLSRTQSASRTFRQRHLPSPCT